MVQGGCQGHFYFWPGSHSFIIYVNSELPRQEMLETLSLEKNTLDMFELIQGRGNFVNP